MTKLSAVIAATLVAACGGGTKQNVATHELGTSTAAETKPAEPTPAPSAEQASMQKPAEPEKAPEPPRKVMKSMTPDELQWGPLIADAGDQGPKTASLWGDKDSGPNGFFLQLAAGDKGKLHTHTNDSHVVPVTAASVQQDGGKLHALASGTYWFQPGGAAHSTACPGKTPCILFVHFNSGKFDIAPATPVKGAKPDPKAIEKTLKSAKWTLFNDKDPKGGAWSSVWGDAQAGENGMLIKLSPGNAAFWHIHSHDYHAVLLQGTLDHHESGTQGRDLPVGSYWYQPGGNKHVDLCKTGGKDCIIYAYFTGKFDAVPAE